MFFGVSYDVPCSSIFPKSIDIIHVSYPSGIIHVSYPCEAAVQKALNRVLKINRDKDLKLSERECARMATLICYLDEKEVDYDNYPTLLQIALASGVSQYVVFHRVINLSQSSLRIDPIKAPRTRILEEVAFSKIPMLHLAPRLVGNTFGHPSGVFEMQRTLGVHVMALSMPSQDAFRVQIYLIPVARSSCCPRELASKIFTIGAWTSISLPTKSKAERVIRPNLGHTESNEPHV